MQVIIQMIITNGDQKTVHDIICFERQELLPETLGITPKESKTMTAAMQQTMITKQVEEYTSKHRTCLYCGKRKSIKGYHSIIYRTLFGKIHIRSPQIIECACRKHETLSRSPLTKLLTDRASPELLYLESR